MSYDWSVLEVEGVEDVVSRAARKISDDFPHTIEYDDAVQDGRMNLAKKAEDARQCIDHPDLGLGVLYTRLVRDLFDQVKTEGKYRSSQQSYERLREGRE